MQLFLFLLLNFNNFKPCYNTNARALAAIWAIILRMLCKCKI